MAGGMPSNLKIAASLVVAPMMLVQKTRGLSPAAQAILEVIVEGARVDYDSATRIESRKLAKTIVSQTTKNMVTALFFHMNAIRSAKSRLKRRPDPKTPSALSPRGKRTRLGPTRRWVPEREAIEDRRTRRRNDGREHRARSRFARYRVSAEGRERRQGA